MAKKFKHATREQWLNAANVLIEKQLFKPLGHNLPKKLRISCAFPSVRPTTSSKQRIGECWSHKASNDGTVEVFISPVLDEPVRVLGVVVHEDVHGIVGLECGHKGPFAKLARKVGLEGKLTATTESAELVKVLKGIVKSVGPYPHAKLNPAQSGRKKQTTRMIKCVCPDTGYVARTTQKWIDEYGAPYGPEGSQMEVR